MREEVDEGKWEAALADWKMLRLSDLAQYHNGVAFKPADWVEDGLPIIRIEQLNNPDREFDRYAGQVAENNRIRNGDLIFSWSATLKAIIWRRGDAVLNQHLFKVVPKPNIDIRFLHFVLDFNMGALGNGSHGSTMKHIKRSELDKFFVPVPPTGRQRKIAAILSTIDTVIEQTEALIEKYQQIKAGLMHDLFTRGVLPNGQLRPPREQAPKLYRETAIGWIPREWSLHSLDVVADVVDPNPSHRNPIYHPAGFPFISTVEFIDNDEVEIDTSRRVIEEIVEEQERRCQFSHKSIGFSRKGTIGAIRFLPVGIRFALLDSLCVINPRVINASYLFHSLRSECMTRQSKNMTMGQALPQVSIGRVRDLLVPMPASDEQALIEERLDAVMWVLKKQSDYMSKLRQQKLGLMQDLLTGKVPVTVETQHTERV